MAKSKSFFSLRRGSTKSQTFSVLRGEQVTKDRVTQVANPKTTAQMRQRALFATAVKFYKHANQNFFKFAFEDKKQRESDYNAFMRHNLKNSVIMGYEQSKNELFPAVGNGWMLTYGSLPSPSDVSVVAKLNFTMGTGEGTPTTWGQCCQRLIDFYGLQSGDILTLVGITSQASTIDDVPSRAPIWTILQYRIDPQSIEAIPSELTVNGPTLEAEMGYGMDVAEAGAVIFSRNIAGKGVKVSTSILENNSIARDMIEALLDENTIEANLQTWGATGKAILQGSLIEPGRAVEPEFVGFRGAGNNLIDAAQTSLSDAGETLSDRAIPGAVNYVLLLGSHLEALDVNKITTSGVSVAVELHRDAVYGYYMTLDFDDSISDGFEVEYDSFKMFTVLV